MRESGVLASLTEAERKVYDRLVQKLSDVITEVKGVLSPSQLAAERESLRVYLEGHPNLQWASTLPEQVACDRFTIYPDHGDSPSTLLLVPMPVDEGATMQHAVSATRYKYKRLRQALEALTDEERGIFNQCNFHGLHVAGGFFSAAWCPLCGVLDMKCGLPGDLLIRLADRVNSPAEFRAEVSSFANNMNPERVCPIAVGTLCRLADEIEDNPNEADTIGDTMRALTDEDGVGTGCMLPESMYHEGTSVQLFGSCETAIEFLRSVDAVLAAHEHEEKA